MHGVIYSVVVNTVCI